MFLFIKTIIQYLQQNLINNSMENNNEISIKQYASFSELALMIAKLDLTSDFLAKSVRQIVAINNKGIKVSEGEMKLFCEKYNDLKEVIDKIISSNEFCIAD